MAAANMAGASVPAISRTINAEHVLLAMVARKAVPSRRWAAMSEHIDTQACEPRRAVWRFRMPPTMGAMQRGRMNRVVQRTRLLHGLAEVRSTWGCGLRAMLAETSGAAL